MSTPAADLLVPPRSRRRGPWGLVLALYLFGIFMGAIDTGIVTPGRTVIQRDLGVSDQVGIWMITVYTLAYAAAIPVLGKLADRLGRRPVYLASIALFGLGSLACGLSQDVGSFGMLVAARAVQAIGGGGILPIATAEIGTEVPQERRGLALGLVGAVYGVANIFGASAGSLILDIVGSHNWQWIFYVNVPIAAAILVAGWLYLPDHREAQAKAIDVWGALLLVAMILSLLYGLRNLDFFDLGASLASAAVWPFLAGFVAIIPVFVLAERRAADPVLNLRYFTDRGVALVLALSLLSGMALMAVVFVPQFAENALRIRSGSGGYTVIALGLASGIGAPLSGTLTDRFGARRVLGLGAVLSMGAAACALLWTIPSPGVVSTFAALGLFGLGLGFVIGSPLNYLMLSRTPASESNSALGTLSLVRSIGTTLAPAIMVGFLAQAGTTLQDRLVAELPSSVPAPVLPYAAQLQATFDELRADPEVADKLGGVEFPDLGSQSAIAVDLAGGGSLPDDLVDLLRTADVTTIVERSKTVASRMFSRETPARVADITDGVQKGIDGLASGRAELATARTDMSKGLADMDKSLGDMTKGARELAGQVATLDEKLSQMDAGLTGLDRAASGMADGIAGLSKAVAGMDAGLAQQRAGLEQLQQLRARVAAVPTRPAASPSAGPSAAPSTPGAGVTPAATPSGEPSPAPTGSGTPEANSSPSGSAEPSSSASTPVATASTSDAPSSPSASASASVATAAPLSAPTAAGGGAMPGTGVAGAAASGMPSLAQVDAQIASLRAAIGQLQDERDAAASHLAELRAQRSQAIAQRAQLAQGRAGAASGRAALVAALNKLTGGRAELATARAKLAAARDKLDATDATLAEASRELGVLKEAVPGAFDGALQTYLAEIDDRAPRLEQVYQATLADGFRGVFWVYGAACLLMLVILPLMPAVARRDA